MSSSSIETIIAEARRVSDRIIKSLFPSGSGAESFEDGYKRLQDYINRDAQHASSGTPTDLVGSGTGKAFSSTAQEAKDVAERIGKASHLAEKLHVPDESKARAALGEFQKLYPDVKTSANPLEQARAHVTQDLRNLTKQGNELHTKHHVNWKGAAAKIEEEKSPRFSEKLSSRISQSFERHEKWLATKSDGAKLGITAAESMLGFVGLIMGINTIYSAATQRIKHRVENTEGGQPEVVLIPFTSTDRLLKLAAGIGVTTAGLTAIAMAARGSGGHSHGM